MAKVNSTETGIKEASIWNNVNYFETARNYYTEWLHEGPEGAAGYGMLVGDLVSYKDDMWQFYLLLRQIVDIVLSRRIQKGCGALLSNLAKEHHTLFNELFPNVNLKPKGHLWMHYSRVLVQSGPIINLSTFRFESKHRDKNERPVLHAAKKILLTHFVLKNNLLCATD